MKIATKGELVIGLASVVLGGLGALYLSFVNYSEWVPLGRPPEFPQRIYAASPDTIIVQGIDGRIFAFRDELQSYWRNGIPQGQWTTQVPQLYSWELTDCGQNVSLITSRPPLKTRDTINCFVRVGENSKGVAYALMDDGSVWRWTTPRTLEVLIGFPFTSCMGALTFLFIGMAILRAVKTLARLAGPAALV